jgi:hypothetical protein
VAHEHEDSPLPPFPRELVDRNKADEAYRYLVLLRLPGATASRHWRRWCIVTGSPINQAWADSLKLASPVGGE